ncbi:chaperonin 10-like protein [Zychaea mexicana]|uniref:chaperonin 10-like protein n=1 Tax=Zychaea mexicana TaxID=64656 RepID=UPI0022FE2B98|nr:chaperonin 10-like protein [Zychaea mexicana]KAI9484356.1 chaperonin 10-like protein [Zychaea mexicana]
MDLDSKPLELTDLPRKQFDDDTVEMDITHCGICASDLFTLDSGWGATDYPCIVGHEITGVVTKVGKNVKNVKVGDRAGVGAQCGSCLNCDFCNDHEENTCEKGVIPTYNGRWPNGDKTFGGYADKWSGHHHFVFKVPDNMPNEIAATFFCAGITTYAPLKRHGVTKGSRVGVIGIGGLGHYGTQWAKAMGAEVIALSHSNRKRDDALKLGCDDFIAADEDAKFAQYKGKLTHILCTSFARNFDWAKYLGLLRANGVFIMVAAPDAPLTDIPTMLLVLKQISITGSAIGSPDEIRDMLDFAAKTGVKPWIQKYPMSKAPEAVQAMRDGKARYRFILCNKDE